MKIKLAIALISNVEEIQKIPKIYRTAWYCIFLSSLGEYESNTLLKYYKGNL